MSISYLIDLYGFWAFFSPDLLAVVIALSGVYLYVNRRRPGEPPRVSTKQKVWFLTGMLCFYLGWGGPLNILGHFSFMAHMLQMSILFLALPPLVILGVPADWLRKVLKPKWVRKPFNVLSRPLIAIVSFNFLFSLYHLPLLFDPIMSNYALHVFTHLVLEIAAFLMWWPAVCPLPEMNRISDLAKIGYILLNGVLLTPACALIIFAEDAMYNLYITGAGMLCLPFGYIDLNTPQVHSLLPISVRSDQQGGGVLMKIAQEIIYGCGLAHVFFNWYRKEREKDREEELEIGAQSPALAGDK